MEADGLELKERGVVERSFVREIFTGAKAFCDV